MIEEKYVSAVNTQHLISNLVLFISLISTLLNPIYMSFSRNFISDLSTIGLFIFLYTAFYNTQVNGDK